MRSLSPSFRRGYEGSASTAAGITGRHATAVALGIYLSAAILLERPVIGHLGSVCACSEGADASQYMWAMVWWPHAILHGLNPFLTGAIWASRTGFNLTGGTSIPAPALLAAPLTAVAGPLVSFNVLSILAPVLTAGFTYRLCVYITRAPIPSILAGYLAGFSSYELSHLVGLLHAELTFVIPAAALTTLRRLDGGVSARRYWALMTVLLTIQLLTSLEIMLTFTCMACVMLGVGYLVAPSPRRAGIARMVVTLGWAYLTTALICAPFLYYALRAPAYSQGWGRIYSADLLGYVVPTPITQVGGSWLVTVTNSFPGNLGEIGTYVGLPLVLVVVWFAVAQWRTRAARILLVALAIAVVWTLGARLWLGGSPSISLPWGLLDGLPLFDRLLPVRLALYVSLIAAVMVAIWLAAPSRRTWARWAIAGLAVVLIIPNPGAHYLHSRSEVFHASVPQPRFFTAGIYRRYIRPGAIVLPIPYGYRGLSLLWQSETHFYFRLASGYFGAVPAAYANDPVVSQLLSPHPAALSRRTWEAFMRHRHVSAIVVDQQTGQPWPGLLAKAGMRPMNVAGVLVYRRT